jgi:hypothetical protein
VQCIALSAPIAFAESASADMLYVADLCEHVSFLGDVNHQISSLPGGARVRIHVKRRPINSLV